MSTYDLFITIIISIALGILSGVAVSEYYRKLQIINQIFNYAKETELYFLEITYECKKYIRTEDNDRLDYLFSVTKVYRKDLFTIKDKDLQESIAVCNRRLYELQNIFADNIDNEDKKNKLMVFDYESPLLSIDNAIIQYKYKENRKALRFRNWMLGIALVLIVTVIVIQLCRGNI